MTGARYVPYNLPNVVNADEGELEIQNVEDFMYMSKKIRQAIIMSVMCGGLIVLPSVYPVNNVPIV